jgi:hypothetical protein
MSGSSVEFALSVTVGFNKYFMEENKIAVWHILPRNDSDIHEETSVCKCEPSVKITEGGVLIVHNSFDGRELIEQANEILKTP